MFNKNDFSTEIASAMENNLVGNGIEKQAASINKYAKALDYLNAVAEIFDELGLQSEAEATTMLLEVIAKKKSKKKPSKSKSKSKSRKSKKNDPATKGLTSGKMEDNLKEKGWVFNADDGFADGHHDSCMCSMCMDADDDHFDMNAYDADDGDDNYTYEKDEHEQDLARRFHELLNSDEEEFEDVGEDDFEPRHRNVMPPPKGFLPREPDFNRHEPESENWRDLREVTIPTMAPPRRR
jgi:hypothetical protein